MQRMVAMYTTENEQLRYIHELDKIVDSYNSRYHRIIRMSPNQAEQDKNLDRVRLALSEYYAKAIHHAKKPKYTIGTYVRAKKHGIFKRSYDEQFDSNFYIIHDIKKNLPFPMYALKDPNGTILDDLYYESEIQPYTSEIWKIEKVVRRRKRGRKNESLVKWLGFPDEQNSWIDDRDLSEKFRR